MRTVLQHAWAEFEHDIRYKSPDGVIDPRIDRAFALAAGLIELADQQFDQVAAILDEEHGDGAGGAAAAGGAGGDGSDDDDAAAGDDPGDDADPGGDVAPGDVPADEEEDFPDSDLPPASRGRSSAGAGAAQLEPLLLPPLVRRIAASDVAGWVRSGTGMIAGALSAVGFARGQDVVLGSE